MKLSVMEPFARGDGPILVVDESNNDIAEGRTGCSHWPGQKRCEVCGMGTEASALPRTEALRHDGR